MVVAIMITNMPRVRWVVMSSISMRSYGVLEKGKIYSGDMLKSCTSNSQFIAEMYSLLPACHVLQ